MAPAWRKLNDHRSLIRRKVVANEKQILEAAKLNLADLQVATAHKLEIFHQSTKQSNSYMATCTTVAHESKVELDPWMDPVIGTGYDIMQKT